MTTREPTVIFLVDASSSMQASLGDGGRRWDAVRAALTGSEGVITRLQDRVRFGLVRYSGVFACPLLQSHAAGLNAAADIDALLAEAPGGSTPTAETLMQARAELAALAGADPGPVSFVLATDGDPVDCEGATDETVRDRVVRQVELAFEEGIRTFVLSVGAELSAAHLQDLANAGADVGMGEPDVPAWRADDAVGLSGLLAEAVDAAVACVAELPWPVDEACEATVTLDGTPLRCSPEAEYRIEGTRLAFEGDACARWEAGATVVVRPPCE